ncbi:MAG: patatin family protein [Deltaproteobacteria bacterium]|nr:patatin family protein [Deltaproteobacteria bacterium]
MNFIEGTSYISRSVRSRLRGFPNKKVLVLEGGGMRGIFTVGVLQAFTEHGFNPWKLIIGASAGALNGIVYAANQIHIARDAFFSELTCGHFIRISNIFRPEKHILNLDWMTDYIISGDEPLNIKRLRTMACPVLLAATRFFRDAPPDILFLNSKTDNLSDAMKATAAMPFFYRGFVPYGKDLLIDGGVLDAIPFEKALEMGFEEKDILVVLTRPKGYRKYTDSFWVNMLYETYYRDEQYSFLLSALQGHYDAYNRKLDKLERHHSIDVIYPPRHFKINRLSKNEQKIVEGFEQGVSAAKSYLHKKHIRHE